MLVLNNLNIGLTCTNVVDEKHKKNFLKAAYGLSTTSQLNILTAIFSISEYFIVDNLAIYNTHYNKNKVKYFRFHTIEEITEKMSPFVDRFIFIYLISKDTDDVYYIKFYELEDFLYIEYINHTLRKHMMEHSLTHL